MTGLIIILMMIAAPCAAFADCILTDSPYKFEVVCSGYNPLSPPSEPAKGTKTGSRSGKPKKGNIESSIALTAADAVAAKQPKKIKSAGSMALAVGMNEEEMQFMLERNRMDGYRSKLEPRERTARK